MRPAQAAAPAEYTIARGDTISAIAGRYGLDTYAVLKLNNLQANTIIYPGQKIKLDGLDGSAGSHGTGPGRRQASHRRLGHGSVYIVKSGDTLGAIAARHGVGFPRSSSWNGLSMGSIIYPGQKIKIGGGSAPAAPSATAQSAAAPQRGRRPPAPPAPAPTPSSPATRSPALPPGTASGSPTSCPPTG